MKKAAIIQNPASGNRKMHEAIPEIKKQLLSKYDDVEIFETKKPGDGAALVSEYHKSFDSIIGAGGDGTVYELVNALSQLEDRPVFGILPGGTCNDFARSLNMPFDPEGAARTIVEGARFNIDIGKADDRFFSNFWGIGLITTVSQEVDSEIKSSFGRLAYYLSALQNAASGEAFRLQVSSPDGQFDGEAILAIAGNGPYTGGMRTFFPNCSTMDGKLDVLIVKNASMKALWNLFQHRLSAEKAESDEIVYFQTRELQINTDPVLTVDTDGERSDTTPASIHLLPSFLSVIGSK
ncbi:diacylglycerol/lipid kinase family protein [Bacillus marinisedimentorum]|uniref:diacylglycerol/lipid kinase family protein n=1 Tax=Bacillus marinisedimentorum TaxID=1821260 RepID=UPI0008722A00|nr:diacylglycerol kinase family protein [Bacillus marinisedimentorum]